MLTRMHVDNYRCMVNLDCEFAATQLIVGPNGAGKSSLFDVLSLLRDFCIRGLPPDEERLVLGGESRTRWQDVPEQTFELEVSGNGGTYLFRLVVDSWGNPARPRVVREEVDFSGKPVFRFAYGEVHLFNDRHEDKVQYPFDWHRSALATITERRDNTILWWFKRWMGGLLCISPDPRRMSAVASLEAKNPAGDLANFADWYRHLRQETEDYDYLNSLREVIEGFQTLRLEDAGERRRELRVYMTTVPAASALASPAPLPTTNGSRNSRSEYPLSFKELSDGQRVLVGLYAVLHFALLPDTTLCFDEPDNFIALREVQPWLERLLSRAEDQANAQVLLASHHPELLNRMAFENGLRLDRPGGRHTRAGPFRDSAQTGLPPAELVARGWDRE